MNGSNEAPRDYDLTCWYFNVRRVMALVDIASITSQLKDVAAIGAVDDQLRKNWILAVLEDALVEWLRKANPPTLGQLLTTGSLETGSLFTYYSNYFFKGLSKVREALHKGKPIIPMAEGYAKLDELGLDQRVSFRFHHEHLTSSSAWGELSGQRRLLMLGAVSAVTDDVIEVTPWVIANPIPDLFRPHTLIGGHWLNRLEIFASQIDSFDRVRDDAASLTKKDLDVLKAIPEASVKQAFAEIIGEPTVPKDWGGERSDLYTTELKLEGRQISAAFAFKGPSKFHPMTVADLGKNGDQIDRLFSEPADLMILQHCHEITAPVRGMMRAYAQQMGKLRLFCLIDGYQTLRILRAYGKCGL